MSNTNEPFGYKNAKKKAENIAGDKEQVKNLLESAIEKAFKYRGKIGDFATQLQLLIEMVRAWRTGEYTRLPWKALVASIAAIVYFLSPIDIIPDFLFGLGFVDDAAIIGFVLNLFSDEVDKFRQFKADKHNTNNGLISV